VLEFKLQLLISISAFETCLPCSESLVHRYRDEDWDFICGIEDFVEESTPFNHIIDFFANCAFPDLLPHTLAYYRGEGPLLKDVFPPEEICAFDRAILKMLKVLLPAIKEQPRALVVLFPRLLAPPV